MSGEVKAMHRQLVALGFELVRDKRHRVYHHRDGGPPLTAPKTPSDHRATRNVVAKGRRIARELGTA